MEDKDLPDFTGKAVIFYIKNAPPACDDGILMEYISFEKRGGRIFLVGRVPSGFGTDWTANCKAVIEWDSVIHYLEFKNMKDYKERASHYKPSIMERLKR